MDLDLWSKIAQRIEKGHIDPKKRVDLRLVRQKIQKCP